MHAPENNDEVHPLPEDSFEIKNRLRALRRERGLSREQLAHLAGINHRSVGYIEKQDYEPSLRLAYRLADIFGVAPQEVFYREPIPERAPEAPEPPEPEVLPEDLLTEQLNLMAFLLDNGQTNEKKLREVFNLDEEELEAHTEPLREMDLLYVAEWEFSYLPFLGRPKPSYALSEEGRKVISAFVRRRRRQSWRRP